MAAPFTTQTININVAGKPLPVTFVTWTTPVFGNGVPLGPAPAATDAPNPRAPNVAKN